MEEEMIVIKDAKDFSKLIPTKQQETHDCECIECGYIIEESEEECEDIKCPKCGGDMREM